MVGINQQSDARNGGDELVQQAQLLCREIRDEEVHPGRIAARPGKARNESELHRIISGAGYDGNGRGRSLCREGRRGGKCNDHGNLIAHQFRRHRWESIILTLDPTVLDRLLIGVDATPFTPFNSHVARFRVKRPYTIAVLAQDWGDKLGLGMEVFRATPGIPATANSLQSSPMAL